MNSTVKNKEKLQSTKKTKDILKRFSILTLSLILLLSSFCLIYADIPVYVQVNPDYSLTSCGTYSFKKSSNVSPNRPIYLVNVGGYINWVSPISQDYTSGYWGLDMYFNGEYRSSAQSSSATSSDGKYCYGNRMSNNNQCSASNSGLTEYSDINTAISALDEALNTVTIKYPYTFQNGYLFVYDLGNTGSMYSFDLTSKSEEYSNLGDYPFPDTNQSYWFSNSLPEIDETTIPDFNAINIHWLKGDKQNIFGQTQDMIATISGTSTGRYLFIYNPPAHYKWIGSSNPTASETVNYPVTVNGVSTGDNFYIYDSVARLADYNQGGIVQGTVGEVGYGSVASDGAITVTTSDGAIYNQVSGGSTDISSANGGSIAENINGLKQTLDDFVNQFIQLLSAPISHIQQLIQSSHQFFDVFSQLFEWLPSELSSVIVSGLIIMVVIGVIKMLL